MSHTGVPLLAIVVFGYQPEIVNQLMKSLTALALHMARELRAGIKYMKHESRRNATANYTKSTTQLHMLRLPIAHTSEKSRTFIRSRLELLAMLAMPQKGYHTRYNTCAS